MRILLVRPNFKIRQIMPPLGLLYVASWLRKYTPGHEIKIIDGLVERFNFRDFRRDILEFKPDIVGITSLDISAWEAHMIAKIAKSVCSRCKVIIGGPYPTADPQRVLGDRNVDYAILGEGEKAMEELINALSKRGDIRSIKGIAFKEKEDFIINYPPKYIDDLDTVPFPVWDLVNLDRYFVQNAKCISYKYNRNRIVPLLTSRGCFLGCIYCLNIFGKKIRYRSMDNLFQEIRYLLRKYRIDGIEIVDEAFSLNRKRMLEFCDRVISEKLRIDIYFRMGLRIEFMDEYLIDRLRRAGTIEIVYGLDPVSLKVQHTINRFYDKEHARRIIKESVRQGIITEGIFPIGCPKETEEEIMNTVRFARSTELLRATFLTPSIFFSKQKLDSFSQGDFISERRLRVIRIKAYFLFYFSLKRMRHLLTKFKLSNIIRFVFFIR